MELGSFSIIHFYLKYIELSFIRDIARVKHFTF